MKKRKNKKIIPTHKIAAKLRREEEIKNHGKQISLTKVKVHKSSKDYKRVKIKVHEVQRNS